MNALAILAALALGPIAWLHARERKVEPGLLVAAIAAVLALGLAFWLPAPTILALALATAALLDRVARIGGPVLAGAALWADPALGFAAFAALALLRGGARPIAAWLQRDTLPFAAGMIVLGLGVVLLPASLLDVPRVTRALLVGSSLVAGLLMARRIELVTVGPRSRRALFALAVALPAFATFAAVPLAQRGGAIDQLAIGLMMAAILFAAGLGTAAFALGLIFLLREPGRTPALILATVSGILAGSVVAPWAFILLVMPCALGLCSLVETLRTGARRDSTVTEGRRESSYRP